MAGDATVSDTGVKIETAAKDGAPMLGEDTAIPVADRTCFCVNGGVPKTGDAVVIPAAP